MRILISFLLLTISGIIFAKPIEVWECKDRIRPNEILVTATVESDRSSGNIEVAGITHDAAFRVVGFNRRWDFELLRNGDYQYAFIIGPNGEAMYYDFKSSSTASPSIVMRCLKR